MYVHWVDIFFSNKYYYSYSPAVWSMNKLFSFFIILDPNLLNIDEIPFKSDELIMYDIK